MYVRRWAAVVVAAGAISLPAAVGLPGATSTAAPPRATAVVADIGPGTNPYHEAFRRPEWTEHPCTVVPGMSCRIPTLDLTLGDDYQTSLDADLAAGVWEAYRPGIVHWVKGTNLLLLTLRSWESQFPEIKDGYGGGDPRGLHGLGTTGAMAQSCPGCYVLVVQDSNSIDGEPLLHISRKLHWVDFVASTNFPGYDEGTTDRYATASHEFASTGRLFFAANGNSYVPGTMIAPPWVWRVPGYDMPPWVVNVGGGLKRLAPPGEPAQECNLAVTWAAKPAEITGDAIQWLPTPASVDEYQLLAGTSFSTPQIAARFGHALVEVRRRLGDTRARGALWSGAPRSTPELRDGRLTAAELRSVLSRTATLYSTADADATCLTEMATWEVAPASMTPWVDLGWGYLDASDAEQAAVAVTGGAAVPAKPAAAEAYMTTLMTARQHLYPAAPTDDDCNGIVTALDTPAGTYYLDARTGGSAWVYQESNGEPGLQSGGDNVFGDPEPDPCSSANPDTLIW